MLTPEIEALLQKHAGTIRKFSRQPEIVLSVAILLADEVQVLIDGIKKSDAETKHIIDKANAEVETIREELKRTRALLGVVCKRCQKKVSAI